MGLSDDSVFDGLIEFENVSESIWILMLLIVGVIFGLIYLL